MSAGPTLVRRSAGGASSRAKGLGMPCSVSSSSLQRELSGLLDRSGAAGDLEQHDRDVVLAPCVVRPIDERAGCRVEIVSVLPEQLEDRVVVDHRRQAVRAEHEHVTGLRGHRHHVDRHVWIRAERARDHGAMRVVARLVGRQAARADELGHQRVVLRHLLEGTVPQEICARVADVADPDLVVLDECDRHRRAHAGDGLVGRRALVDASGSRPRSAPRRDRRPSDHLPRRGRPPPPPAATRALRPARRPCRPRSRTAAARRRRHPRCGGGGGRGRSGLRSGARSSLEPEVGLADADHVAGRELAGLSMSTPLTARAVRRADVLEPDAVPAGLDAGVLSRCELVVERDVVRVAAADGDGSRVDLVRIRSGRRSSETNTSRPRPVAPAACPSEPAAARARSSPAASAGRGWPSGRFSRGRGTEATRKPIFSRRSASSTAIEATVTAARA